jgi:hypothetical protein
MKQNIHDANHFADNLLRVNNRTQRRSFPGSSLQQGASNCFSRRGE